MASLLEGFDGKLNVLIIGARGGVGGAFVDNLSQLGERVAITSTSRQRSWVIQNDPRSNVTRKRLDICSDEAWTRLFDTFRQEETSQNLVINCSGILHGEDLSPERRARDFDLEKVRRVFEVNTFGVALMIKHGIENMPRRGRCVLVSLSARVGSIGDNRLGGWYSYRASKAAQNMLIKTAAHEIKRRNPDALIAALHPGTVDTSWSNPFTKRLKSGHQLLSPLESATYLTKVISTLTPVDSGGFFAWDGQPIPW